MVTALREAAKLNKIWLSLGGFQNCESEHRPENKKIEENDKDNKKMEFKKLKNSHIVINDNGEIVQIYDKLHMFDIDID